MKIDPNRGTRSSTAASRKKPATRHLRRACNLIVALAVGCAVACAVASYYSAGHPARNLTLPWTLVDAE